jgi:hypothetical protein
MARVSGGRGFANGVDAAVSGTYERSDGVDNLYFPVFDAPATNHGVAEGLDGERLAQLYGQVRFKNFAVTGAYGQRQRDVPTASFGTVFNQLVPMEQTTSTARSSTSNTRAPSARPASPCAGLRSVHLRRDDRSRARRPARS